MSASFKPRETRAIAGLSRNGNVDSASGKLFADIEDTFLWIGLIVAPAWPLSFYDSDAESRSHRSIGVTCAASPPRGQRTAETVHCGGSCDERKRSMDGVASHRIELHDGVE